MKNIKFKYPVNAYFDVPDVGYRLSYRVIDSVKDKVWFPIWGQFAFIMRP